MAATTERAESDNVWKEVIDLYFEDFMAFFFPQIHQDIAWNRDYQFLDKELGKVMHDSEVGKRLADKLVQLYLNTPNAAGETEVWLLIHLEVQGYDDPNFERRMFEYNYRIYDRYQKEVISLAVLTDPGESYRPSQYQVARWGFELSFKFPTVKLLDYNKRWTELEANANPFAVVVMAQLKALQVKKPRERLAAKTELVRLLYARQYSRQQILELFRFIDWLIRLPKALELEFREELNKFEKEGKMPYVTSIEQIGMEKGATAVVLRLIKRRLGEIEPALEQQISSLSLEQLEELGEAVLDIPDQATLKKWVESKAAAN